MTKKKAKAKAEPEKTAGAKAAAKSGAYHTPEDKQKGGVKIWSPEDAQKALAAGAERDGSPEVADSFTPEPGEGPSKKKLGPPLPRKPKLSLEEQAEARGREVEAEQEASALAVREGKTVGPPLPRSMTVTKPGEEQPEAEVAATDSPAAEPDVEAEFQLPAGKYGAGIGGSKRAGPHGPEAAQDELIAEVAVGLWEMLGFDPKEGKLLTAFYQKRERVTLELKDGTFTIPAVVALKTKYSIMLLLPLDNQGTTFVPRPGTQLEIRLEGPGEGEKVYFPGTYCEVPPLKLAVMAFIREQEE